MACPGSELAAHAWRTAGDAAIKIHRVQDADSGEAQLYCHSPAREQKDRAIDDAKSAGFEALLQKLVDGLGKSAGVKSMDKIMEKVGRAKQRYARAAQHYQVQVVPDEGGEFRIAARRRRFHRCVKGHDKKMLL